MSTVISVTRRQMFADLALLAGGGALLVSLSAPSSAVAKMPKTAVSYQPTPKGSARCDTCVQWQSPDACKVVDGNISPSGWCSIYMKK